MKHGLRKNELIRKLGELQSAMPSLIWAARQELGSSGYTLTAKDRSSGEVVHIAEDLRPVALKRYIEAIMAGLALASQ